MTPRLISIVLLALALLVASPQRADAHWWEFLEELSGPGPSKGGEFTLLATMCFESDLSITPRDSTARTRTGMKLPCWFVDQSLFKNDDDDNFPARVTISSWNFGPTWKFLRYGQVEVGAGIGWMTFEGPDGDANKHFTITPFRLAVAPIALFAPPSSMPGWMGPVLRNWSSSIKVYARGTLIPGDIDATNFGVPLGTGPGQSTFTASNDFVMSAGIVLDLGELFLPR